MIVIRLVVNLLKFIKSLLNKEELIKDDEFASIYERSNELIFLLYGVKSEHWHSDVQRLKNIKDCLNQMLTTEQPDIFAVRYQDALEFAKEIHVYGDEKINMVTNELIALIENLKKPEKESVDEGLIYYSVTFRNKRRTYYYLSGGKEYRVGQHVLAPAGEDMKTCVVRVVNKEYFNWENAPMHPDDLKTIFGPALY